jgi:hypothetical protein
MSHKRYLVIKKHISNYPNPITVKKGDRVKIGRIYVGSENWPNWVYCYKLDLSQEGWIPEQFIDREGYGIINEDYTAKELTIDEGELVEGFRELNGWIWCKKITDGEEGWLPMNNIRLIAE